jgi:ferredoxin
MVPFKSERMMVVACSNKDMGRDVKAVCKVGCIGCTACSKAAAGLFKMDASIARVDYDQYDPASMDAAALALNKCPAKVIQYVGKPSPEDLVKVADKEAPAIVKADFKTTVDKTEWHG